MDKSVDEQTRVLCVQMADELELVNIAEARSLGPARERPRPAEQPVAAGPTAGQEEFEARVKKKYKKKYKRKLKKARRKKKAA